MGKDSVLSLNFRTYKKKFTYDVLSGIATCLLDGTVFEIVKGLEDIQQLSERNLLNKRMKIVNSQKGSQYLVISFKSYNLFCLAYYIIRAIFTVIIIISLKLQCKCNLEIT